MQAPQESAFLEAVLKNSGITDDHLRELVIISCHHDAETAAAFLDSLCERMKGILSDILLSDPSKVLKILENPGDILILKGSEELIAKCAALVLLSRAVKAPHL